jgi:hypothetical protein
VNLKAEVPSGTSKPAIYEEVTKFIEEETMRAPLILFGDAEL